MNLLAQSLPRLEAELRGVLSPLEIVYLSLPIENRDLTFSFEDYLRDCLFLQKKPKPERSFKHGRNK